MATRQRLPGIVREALARIETLLDTLFESSEDAILLMDGLHFIDCNPATVRMFGGRTKEDILSKTPLSISPSVQPGGVPSAEEARRLVAAAMAGESQHFEWRPRKFDGTEFDVDVSLNRCFVSGRPFLVAVVRDITARKRAEAALKREILEDQLMNRILGQFAGFVPGEFDANVENALHQLAEFVGADHGFLFMVSADRATYSCTHETCGAGVLPIRQNFQNVLFGSHEWIEPTLRTGQTRRAESMLLISTSGATQKVAGAIGVESHDRQTRWSDSDVMLCSLVGDVLTVMTERKRAADRVIQEKQFSDRLIESLPGAFYLYDSNLRLRRWNKNHEIAMGYTADELLGKKVGEFQATEEHRGRVLEAALRSLQDGGDIEVLQTELLYKDGSVVPYLLTGARIDSPEGPMLAGVGLNISAQVQAQKALAASEHKYRELFNATNDAIFIHNEAGHVLEVNERACAMFGLDVQKARRMSIGEVSSGEPPYSDHDALAKIQRAISEGPQVFDWQSKTVNGELFWSEVALRAFRIEGEVRVIASVRDITDRKLAALERERLTSELQAANSAKDQFLATLSHELRTPLAAIEASIGALQPLLNPDKPRALGALDTIERNVKLQARLVNDLVDLSRLTRGKLAIEKAPVQLGDVVLSAAEMCGPDAARAGVAIEHHCEAGLWVDADAARIQQLVINLIENGIKFTPRGGRVTVSVSAKEGRGQIVVEDTGVGIEADRLSNIFEMFRQGEIAARRAPGLGIGLALVKSIADLHGGRVWAESAGPGRGSRFTVELPLRHAPEKHVAQKGPDKGRAVLRMLVVEDNTDARTMLTEALSYFDYIVLPAESAEQALDILEHERAPVDAILADIGLPGMDGYEFLGHARRLPSAAYAPAFALTGYGQESDRRRAREAGYADHLVKPVNVEVIDQRIRSCVGNSPN